MERANETESAVWYDSRREVWSFPDFNFFCKNVYYIIVVTK